MYRLLVADDDEAACGHVRSLLDWKSLGVDMVAAAVSYEQAVDMALDLRPHIALIDVSLGGGRGLELVRRLQAVGLDTVFAMTDSGGGGEDRLRRSMQAGARDHLTKPLDAEQVRAFVSSVLPAFPLPGDVPRGTDPITHREYARMSKTTNKMLLVLRSADSQSTPPSNLQSLGESLDMNSKYLGRVFLRDTGMKLSEYLLVYRMERARQLILTTREKISVIAHIVGYSQLNRFYVHFRTYFGMSPGDLRAFEARSEDGEERERL